MMLSRSVLAMRRSAAPLSRAMSSHWSNLESMVPESRRAEFNAKVADLRKRQEAAAVSGVVEPIDWAAFAEKLGDAAAVDKVKAQFNAHQYTDFDGGKADELADLEATQAQTMGELAAKQAEMAQFSADAAAQLAELRRNVTTADTTLDDVLARYPEIHAEMEADIEGHYWDCDNVAPVDIQAQRMALIKERWNAGAFGALDENTMKEFLDEVEASSGASSASDRGLLDAPHRKALGEWCELLGKPAPTDEQVASWIETSKGQLSDADKALTHEAELWDQIMAYEASGEEARALNLFEHMKSLKAAGELGECEEWRLAESKAMTASAPPALGSFDASELEGKSHDEMVEMAEAAADSEDYYRASQIMLAAHKASGAIDAKSTAVDSFSGLMNFIDRIGKKSFSA